VTHWPLQCECRVHVLLLTDTETNKRAAHVLAAVCFRDGEYMMYVRDAWVNTKAHPPAELPAIGKGLLAAACAAAAARE
jgi:hypothetical protein